MSAIFEALGGRKAVGLILLIAIGVPVAITLGDIPDNLLYLLLGAFGTFVSGNAINSIAYSRVDKAALNAAPQAAVDNQQAYSHSEIEERLDRIEQALGSVNRADSSQVVLNRLAAIEQVTGQVAQTLIQLVTAYGRK